MPGIGAIQPTPEAIKPSYVRLNERDGRDGQVSALGEGIPIGKFFERTGLPALHEAEPALNTVPLAHVDMRIAVNGERNSGPR